MAEPSRPTSTPSADWPTQVTDAIVGFVDSTKHKVNGPATSIARGVVYGTLAALIGTAALVLGLVLTIRVIDILVQVVLDFAGLERAGRSAWIAHLITGLLMAIPGYILLRKGMKPAADNN